MLEMMWREWLALPGLLRIGGLVFAVASALDLAFHALPAAWTGVLERYAGPDGHWAHEAIMAGMLLIVLGLLAQGLARPVHARTGVRQPAKEVRQDF